MTYDESKQYINCMARLIKLIEDDEHLTNIKDIYSLSQFIEISEQVHSYLNKELREKDTERLLNAIMAKLNKLRKNQEDLLFAYHMLIWMDQIITYEETDDRQNLCSIAELVPLKLNKYTEIEALNDNYREIGIWINPKLQTYKSYQLDKDKPDKHREYKLSNRQVFTGLNGELKNISYFIWDDTIRVHNIIVPFDLEGDMGDGKLRIGFLPISDRRDLVEKKYDTEKENGYDQKVIYINKLKNEDLIEEEFIKGMELSGDNNVDIVFAPEILGTQNMQVQKDGYNQFILKVYQKIVLNGGKIPLFTVMPSYWKNRENKAAIIGRNGKILGFQRKYTPYYDIQSHAKENIKEYKTKDIYILHINKVHPIAVSICADFIDNYDHEFICGQLGATLIIVPSFSSGEKDFLNNLLTLIPYGTSVIWGDCCGAIEKNNKVIGGCGIVGVNSNYKMGDYCKCNYSCDSIDTCAYIVELPLKIYVSNKNNNLVSPIKHYIKR